MKPLAAGALAVSLSACLSPDGLPHAEGDGSLQDGDSLCTEARDPRDSFCRGGTRLTSKEAYELAKTAVSDAGLIMVMSSRYGVLNVDGKDETWEFWFQQRDSAVTTIVKVENGELWLTIFNDDEKCNRTISVLDSATAVRAAVQHVEADIGTFTHGAGNVLFMSQMACSYGDVSDHHVTVLDQQLELGPNSQRWYFARYEGDGELIEYLGPCLARDWESCKEPVP